MKIGLVTPYFYPLLGGVQEHVANLYLNLKARGHEARIITSSFLTKSPPVEFDEMDVIRIGLSVPYPINGSIGWYALPWKLRTKIREVLSRERFDLLHINESFIPGLPLTILKEAKCKLISTFHAAGVRSSAYRLGRFFLKEYFEKLDGRIAVSQAAKDFVGQYFRGEFEIIPNGVDLEKFKAGKTLRVYDDGQINILFVGRLDRRKGLPHLLKAFRVIKKRFKEVRLIVVGSDRKCIKEDVHFVGKVPPKYLQDYYHTAHIFCSPATGRESFGIILIEAMAAGIPIVASSIPGYNEVVTSGREGLLVPPKDPFSLTQALAALISNPDLRREMGIAGRRRAEEFSWSVVTDSILAYYQRVMNAF